jgi:hypothetical protein
MPSRLEQYLDEVSRPLPPGTQRAEWRTETEQHLSALIAAYEELGHSHEEATELAVSRFGEAREIGRQVKAETRRSTTRMGASTVVFLVPVILGFVAMAISASLYAQTGNEHLRATMMVMGHLFDGLAFALGGWWFARRLSNRLSLWHALCALLVGVPICFISFTFLACIATSAQKPSPVDVLPRLPVRFAIAATSALITRAVYRYRSRKVA